MNGIYHQDTKHTKNGNGGSRGKDHDNRTTTYSLPW